MRTSTEPAQTINCPVRFCTDAEVPVRSYTQSVWFCQNKYRSCTRCQDMRRTCMFLFLGWFSRIRKSNDHWASMIKANYKSTMGARLIHRMANGPSELIGIIKLISSYWKDMAISWMPLTKIAMNELKDKQPINSNPTISSDNRFEFYDNAYSIYDLDANFTTANVFVNAALDAIERNTKISKPITLFYILLEGIPIKKIKEELHKQEGFPGENIVRGRLQRFGFDSSDPPSTDHLFKNHYLTPYEVWFRYKLATSSLRINGQMGENDGLCQICNNAEETTLHLFFYFPFTMEIILYSTRIIREQFDHQTSIRDWLCSTSSAQNTKLKK